MFEKIGFYHNSIQHIRASFEIGKNQMYKLDDANSIIINYQKLNYYVKFYFLKI